MFWLRADVYYFVSEMSLFAASQAHFGQRGVPWDEKM